MGAKMKSPFKKGIPHSKTDQVNAKQEYDVKFNMGKLPKKMGIGRQVFIIIYYFAINIDIKYKSRCRNNCKYKENKRI